MMEALDKNAFHPIDLETQCHRLTIKPDSQWQSVHRDEIYDREENTDFGAGSFPLPTGCVTHQ